MGISCLFTSMTDDFDVAFGPFWRSFIGHNPWFEMDFVILDLGCSLDTRRYVENLCRFVKWIKPKTENYKKVNMSVTAPRLRSTYYKLDAFSLFEYDTVVSIDLDMIVLQDIREVFTQIEEFSACASFREPDRIDRTINSGLFVVNNHREEMYRRLIEIAEPGHAMPDQFPINRYFAGNINYLPKKYNVEKRMQHSSIALPMEEVAILHYVGQNPWELFKNERCQGYEDLEALWWEYYPGEDDGKDFD